ncbi:uncharacterized protein [Littorina saxatilis]|uniref:SOCS box domain-containing protein n=1 Tax=Littorina saxatilis TaxID=31220 RepID=A0AAN9AI22_9CAEN
MDLHNSWNGDVVDLSSRLPRLRQLVLSSDWGQVAQTLKDVDRDTLAGVEFILNRALGEQQWGCITALTTHCSLQQRSVVVDQAVKCGQWPCVLEAVKLGVAVEVKDVLFMKAVDEGQRVIVTEITMLGVSSESRERACERAVQLQQWDVVQTLVEMGLSCAVRSTVLKAAVAQRHVECAVKAMKLGVSTQDKEDALRQAVVSGQCHFLLELVKLSSDADLTDFVLREAVKQSEWGLVERLVGQGLGDVQKEHVLDEAVACGQWDLALTLLRDGVSPREWIIDELFRNKMGHGLVDQFPDGAMPSGLKGLMLMGAIKHSDGDTALRVIHHQSVSDVQLMEAIKYAVNLLDKEVLMQLLRGTPRSRRVFKYNFHKQQWKWNLQPLENEDDRGDGGEVFWILKMLCENNEDDLALHVAVTQAEQGDGVPMQHFFRMKPEAATLKRRKVRVALWKLHDKDEKAFGDTVAEISERSKEEVRLLFRLALRNGDLALALSLCKHGVQRKDLKFAFPWFFTNEDPKTISGIRNMVNAEDIDWFRYHVVMYALVQFSNYLSEPKLKTFIVIFEDCYMCDDSCRQLFRSAIWTAVLYNAADLFAEVCAVHFNRDDHVYMYEEDFRFAFDTAMKEGNSEMIKTASGKMLWGWTPSYKIKMVNILMELIFENKAWGCLPSIEMWDKTPMLKCCLLKMVKNEVPWQKCTKTLCQWIKDLNFDSLDRALDSLRETLRGEEWQTRVSSLAQWCMEKLHSNLAVLLGFVLSDWQLVTSAVGQRNLDLPENLLLQAAVRAARNRGYCAAAALLRLCSLTRHSLGSFSFRPDLYFTNEKMLEGLVAACQKEGLYDWAVGLSTFDMKSMKEKLQTCHNQVVLDHVLSRAACQEAWDVVKELLTRCTESDHSLLLDVLKRAVRGQQLEVSQALINRVDASAVLEKVKDCWFREGGHTLLSMAVNYDSHWTRLDLIRLCIASGLSTFQRDMPIEQIKSYFEDGRTADSQTCPVLYILGKEMFSRSASHVLNMKILSIISLMLRSGAVANKGLYQIRFNAEMQSHLRSKRIKSDTWRKGYKMVIKAASNPSRLEHLARLVVSHDIGCRPGRSDRIQSLPVPDRIKDLVNFKDVLSCEPETDPSMEVEDVYTGYPFLAFDKFTGNEELTSVTKSTEEDLCLWL